MPANSRAFDVEDCSRAYLEQWAEYLRERIAAGEDRLRPLLARVEAAIPRAPDYFITHAVD